MKKYIFIGIATIVLVMGAGIFLGVKNNFVNTAKQSNVYTVTSGSQEGLGEAKQENVVITYTDSGFSPNVLSVRNGGTVVFKNESNKPMLIASAPHPADNDYPELNSTKSLNKGESYSFTFTKSGSWGFHNNLYPSDTGMITVQ